MNSINEEQTSLISSNNVKNLIYSIRNQQVMLDSDLAILYQIDTGRLNEAVKRNSLRFPENFRFQLTKDEYEILRSQFATSKLDNENEVLISQFAISKSDNGIGSRGGRRNLPYVFTEQGIAMLSAVLKSDTAINVSIRIMESFVEMRRYMANTSLVHQRLDVVEKRQQETENRLEQVFDYIAIHEESEQKVLCNKFDQRDGTVAWDFASNKLTQLSTLFDVCAFEIS